MIRRMHFPSIIERKRDGAILTDEEIREVIRAFTLGEMPDYQMSALAMAIYFQGMTARETASLTRSMLESGERMHYPGTAPRVVDKHSTGGVGDKVSLILAPLLACDDLWVPMISGRGLGITGGTLDKLESIPGFRVGLSQEEALAQLSDLGVVMMGQTATICPADKKLYALRDVTATVPSRPLIVASIMSKKLAESLDALVLDVKFGSGAFMKTRDEATALGEAMREVGEAMGVLTRICYHSMDEPTGRAVGNALEVVEAIDVLRGGGPADLRQLVISLASEVSFVDPVKLGSWLDDGTAWKKFQHMVAAQGGDTSALEDFGRVHPALVIREVRVSHRGVVRRVDADTVGRASLALGAGRSRADEAINPAVGFDQLVKVGEEVKAGDVVVRIHAASESGASEAEHRFRGGFLCE
ncbi:MAG TPA: thymidine phosphorylase [Verrucomicrobiales bacterium]|nr:thymidine phosphorylase [Verrucomicrobiales bacterium]